MTEAGEVVGGPIGPGEGGEAHRTAALMLTFGAVHPGRERLAVETFTELSRFFGEVLADGLIESFAPYFHEVGSVGETTGFFLVEGEQAPLDDLRRRDDFQRLVLKAGAATAAVRVHVLVAGAAAGRRVNDDRNARDELGLLGPADGVTSTPPT